MNPGTENNTHMGRARLDGNWGMRTNPVGETHSDDPRDILSRRKTDMAIRRSRTTGAGDGARMFVIASLILLPLICLITLAMRHVG